MQQIYRDQIGSYVTTAFAREQRDRGRLPHSREEFLTAVWGQITVMLSEGYQEQTGEPVTGEQMKTLIEDFEGRIREARNRDRQSRAAGQKPEAFKSLDERKILAGAIRKVIADDRPPRREKEEYPGDLEGVAGVVQDPKKTPDPSDVAEISDTAAKMYKALGELEPLDQDILRLELDGLKQVEIARKLGCSPQTVSRRKLEAIERLKRRLGGCRDR